MGIGDLLLVVGVLLLLAFAFVIPFGAPFVPTLKGRVPVALELLDLKPGQTLLELGSGDGRVLLAAAKSGLNAVGYELNPLLVWYSRLRLWKYRKQTKVILGSFWGKDWPPADGIFAFILQPYMERLDRKIIQEYGTKKIKLVSFGYPIKSRKHHKKAGDLFLYTY